MKNSLEKYADNNQLEIYKHFPSTHYLSKLDNVLHVLAWGTFFRRNMHRFVIDYLCIQLFEYQALAIYEMGLSNLICIIASRNDAKSFIVAVYAVARCLLYKGTKFRIGSSTEKQAKLIVSEKIIDELDNRRIQALIVYVMNSLTFELGDTYLYHEEISKELIKYKKNKDLKEQPVDIYISSSWYDDGNWMWGIADQAMNAMIHRKDGLMLAFDESIAIKHELKTVEQLIKEKKKQDPATWQIEFLNLKVRDSLSSYFTYSMLISRQVSKHPFYPRNVLDYKNSKKNKYAIPKLDNEVRVISNDIAFVAGNQNDNSVYACIRGIPESVTYESDNHSVEIKQGYHRSYPYLESNQIGDTTLQAIRIRQLYEDFNADYIVIDSRNGGLQVVYTLQKVLYDEERGVEYAPLKCMNNDEYSKVCSDPSAKPCIFVINATQNLNSDIAIAFRKNLTEGKIDFLVNFNTAQEDILFANQDYINNALTDNQIDYERPFLETQALINECAELQYEKMPQTGVIKIHEQGKNRKDRYTAASYGSYFFDQLELDMLSSSSDYEYTTLIN